MIQTTFDYSERPKSKTMEDVVFDFLKNHRGIYYTGFEIANELMKEGIFMTEGSCSKYLRNMRNMLGFKPRIREHGKPFIEWSYNG